VYTYPRTTGSSLVSVLQFEPMGYLPIPKESIVSFPRWLSTLTVISTVAAASQGAQAEDKPSDPYPAQVSPSQDMHHRFAFGGGVAATYRVAGIDGHDDDNYARAHGRFAYGYRVVRGFELGADVTVYSVPLVIPSATFRPYLPIGARDVVEIGLDGRVGMMVMPESRHTWMGLGWSVGPDVRVWFSDEMAVQFAGELTLAGGSTHYDHNDPADVYVSDAFFAAIGGSLAFIWRH
jgi:hypothetical protein